jgi:hypothetical protein
MTAFGREPPRRFTSGVAAKILKTRGCRIVMRWFDIFCQFFDTKSMRTGGIGASTKRLQIILS